MTAKRLGPDLLDRGMREQSVLIHALRASLCGGDAAQALAALESTGDAGDSPTVRWLLWYVTGDRLHLERAEQLIEATLAQVPIEHHAAMRANLRWNRDVLAALRGDAADRPTLVDLTDDDSDTQVQAATRIE